MKNKLNVKEQKVLTEREGLNYLAMILASAGVTQIQNNLPAGIALLLTALGVIFLRGKYKMNGRWKV